MTQVWYADDVCACGSVSAFHNWYKHLCDLGPRYGYIVNATKTWLVVKPPFQARASELFTGTGVNLLIEGHPYLGATIGSRDYMQKYVEQKVDEWSTEVQRLTNIAESQPHAAYSALTHSFSSRWHFVAWIIPNLKSRIPTFGGYHLPLPFACTLLGISPPNDSLYDLLALHPQWGGMGIFNPSEQCNKE